MERKTLQLDYIGVSAENWFIKFVIHKQDNERIGCGILSKSKKSC